MVQFTLLGIRKILPVLLLSLFWLDSTWASPSFSLRAKAKEILDGASPPDVHDGNSGEEESRIIGGANANLDEYPFFVSVRYYGGHYCGGVLLDSDDKQWILSAAHCQFGDIKDATAIVSAYKTNIFHETHIPVDIIQRIPHPQYDPRTQENDVALLRLSRPIPGVQGVKVNVDVGHPYDGEVLTVIGMGNTNAVGGKYIAPDTLRKTQVNAVPHDVCAAKFSPWSISQRSMLCARAPGRDSCNGDSGGPILSSSNKVVGVTSFGGPCASDYPGVYTRMSGVSDWICRVAPGSCADPEPVALVGSFAPDEPGQGAQAPAGDTCDDDKKARFPVQGKGNKRCVWLNDPKRQSFRDELCVPGNPAMEACRETCGACTDTCEDGFKKFLDEGGARRNCLWLSLRVREQKKYCVEGHDAFSICNETCDNCQ